LLNVLITGVEGGSEPVPILWGLSSYPNPFNSSITIRYSLREPSTVSIEIYDLLGRRIDNLPQGRQQAGNHQIIWQANSLSSGVYFYRIRGKNYSDAREMLLLK
jgi:hypothetical protein